jgi:hypothetical protein
MDPSFGAGISLRCGQHACKQILFLDKPAQRHGLRQAVDKAGNGADSPCDQRDGSPAKMRSRVRWPIRLMAGLLWA